MVYSELKNPELTSSFITVRFAGLAFSAYFIFHHYFKIIRHAAHLSRNQFQPSLSSKRDNNIYIEVDLVNLNPTLEMNPHYTHVKLFGGAEGGGAGAELEDNDNLSEYFPPHCFSQSSVVC